MSTFLSSFDHVNTENTQNPNVEPTPGDLSAVYRNAAEYFEALRRTNPGEGEHEAGADTISRMIEELWVGHEHPPTKNKGVSEVFIAGTSPCLRGFVRTEMRALTNHRILDLDRIPKKNLKAGDSCPICRMPFLDDEYPLVVRLPCHKEHIFDLECLQPWLKMNNSCPLDRKELEKKKAPPPPPQDDEEEYDDMYA